MTTDGSDQKTSETIDERVERLMRERHDGASLDVIAGHYEEYLHEFRLLTAHSKRVILLECLSNGSIVKCNFMERKILTTFMDTHVWYPSLEVRFEGGLIRWVNAIAHARKELVNEEKLMKADKVPGHGFLLVTGAEEIARKTLHDQDMESIRTEKETELNGAKKKRKRAEAEVEDPDAVYIIVDPKRPGCCKIGAGNGKCLARLSVARLWTNGEAELKHVEPVGSGKALRVEHSVRYELGKTYRVNGEWVDCKFSTAVPVLESWGKKARELY
jgi:hypothetical protein